MDLATRKSRERRDGDVLRRELGRNPPTRRNGPN